MASQTVVCSADGKIPYDGVPNMIVATVEVGVTALFSVLATAGLVLTVICLTFNFIYRNTK